MTDGGPHLSVTPFEPPPIWYLESIQTEEVYGPDLEILSRNGKDLESTEYILYFYKRGCDSQYSCFSLVHTEDDSGYWGCESKENTVKT